MRIELFDAREITSEQISALKSLSTAVYPPESTLNWPGQTIEWATPQWRTFCRDERGDVLSHVGIFLRQGQINGIPVTIGGIGQVLTHPDSRRQGLASKGIERSIDLFRDQGVDFALLVCEPNLVPMYQKLNWQSFLGTLLVKQRGIPGRFTFNLPMTIGVLSKNPSEGTIDLMGPPW
ncbi:MAG: hypothetical protein A2X86_20780 [Bdellovibrionales bacterium GWA2_49_15]|nr:MAG: hypothetical protein A2X86_20780 [Bdellovibrionales bacterium GWA2_49_15]